MKNTLIYKHKTSFGTVFLKSRKNGLNPESLYLEIYLKVTQKRHLEFLGLYFIGNPITDDKMKQEAIGKCIHYVCTDKKVGDMTFTDFCLEQTAKIDRVKSGTSYYRAIKKLNDYAKSDAVYFHQINEKFLLGFREWLLNKALNDTNKEQKLLHKNTADLYT